MVSSKAAPRPWSYTVYFGIGGTDKPRRFHIVDTIPVRSEAHDPASSIGRALLLIRLLATAGARGLALSDLARATDFPHATVHRMLRRLIIERMVRQLTPTRRYTLGVLAFELGLAASPQFDMRAQCRRALAALVERVDDTVYLIGRSGFEAVCLDRFEGQSPIRVLEIEVGSRRPLGLGAGGLAILSALSEEDIRAVIARVAHDPWFPTRNTEQIIAAALEARRRGYATVRDRVTAGVSAVGVPIKNSLGSPIAAVTVAAIHARMPQARMTRLAQELRQTAAEIEPAMRDGPAHDA